MSSPVALLIDDDVVVQLLVSSYLSSLGFVVEGITSVADARNRLNDLLSPQVVLLDLFLSDGSGKDLLGFISERQYKVPFPTILMTSHEDSSSVLGDGIQPTAFLQKPFTIQELRSCLQSIGVMQR
jgi:DNA-binding NtrC family response regulator